MKKLLTFFYMAVVVVVSFILTMRLVARLAAKRYGRHLRKIKAHLEYMSIRVPLNDSLLEEWDRLQVYAQWLRDRATRRVDESGKHLQSVSDEEIKELLGDCTELLKSVVRAQCLEHWVIETLPSNDGIAISKDDHDKWHWIQHGTERIEREFKVLLKNKYRNTVR